MKKVAERLPVGVADLLRSPGRRRTVELDAVLPDLRTSSAEVPAEEPVAVSLVLEAVSGTIVATGTAAAPWRGECGRCLRTVQGTLRARVQELFEPDPREGETYLLAGDQIDLAPMVREVVLLELPIAPLCEADCAGLCPRCGADRNEVACGCAVEDRDPRWAALDTLRLPED